MTGQDRVHSASFGVTLLEWVGSPVLGAFSSPAVLVDGPK
jgi:hypothetical protein